jgi:SAM-dependent methyltransferase
LTADRPALDLETRDCPICGSSSRSVPVAEARIDTGKLDDFAFASRKRPEYMHHRLVLCEACDLLYASPAPTAEALHQAYGDAAYDSAEESAYASATYGDVLTKVVTRLPPTGGALDIGTGDGSFLSVLLAAGFDDVVGVEPSAAPVEAAAPEVRPLIRQAPFDPHDFEPGRFRLVTSFQTLEHLSEPQAMCRDAYELLAPGGALYVITHNRRAVPNRVLGRRSPIFDIEHLQLFSPPSLRRLLEGAGFTGVELRPIVNRYPLRYWLRLLPVPSTVTRRALALVGNRVASAAIPLPAGNMAAVGYKSPPR